MEIGVLGGPSGVLSDRELEVLAIVAADKTDREIASKLAISERTVRAHVSRIIRKLGVASRVGAAVVFVEWKVRVEPVPAGAPMVACRV
ncbi:LuxR C-terminal-related transcriptional regulator [Amycolatopsis sp. NPDC098790]|uniref:helix-turn-helix domain-containing protein n=1 Tax=Amycolatopsis sp. NPDC098790 TaxID=3363939 RepID=UPI00382D6E95